MENWSSDRKLAGSNGDWLERLSNALLPVSDWSDAIQDIVQRVADGVHLSLDDGVRLYEHPNLHEVGQLAHYVRTSRFGNHAYFNSNVHINQTNVCVLACRFCAFRRGPKADDAYSMDIQEYIVDLERYAPYVDEVHSVGGLHPDWDVAHYESLFKRVREEFPHVSIKALTAVEIKHLGQLSSIPTKEVLRRLHDAGLTSLPGGGAEILDDDVRSIICNGKESSEEYIRIHREAHELGIPSNCTMLFGTVESLAQRVQHMIFLENFNHKPPDSNASSRIRSFLTLLAYPKLNWRPVPRFFEPLQFPG